MQPSRLPPEPWAGHRERHASAGWPQDPAETHNLTDIVMAAISQHTTDLIPDGIMHRRCWDAGWRSYLETSQDSAPRPEPLSLLQAAQAGYLGPLQRLHRQRPPLHRRAEVRDAHLRRHAPARQARLRAADPQITRRLRASASVCVGCLMPSCMATLLASWQWVSPASLTFCPGTDCANVQMCYNMRIATWVCSFTLQPTSW